MTWIVDRRWPDAVAPRDEPNEWKPLHAFVSRENAEAMKRYWQREHPFFVYRVVESGEA